MSFLIFFQLHKIAMTKMNAVPFHEKEYWRKRFEKEKHFEWLVTWDDIKEEFEPYLKKDEDVLHLGNEKCIRVFEALSLTRQHRVW